MSCRSSIIGTDAWLDAPTDWAGLYSLSTVPLEPPSGAAACASLDSGD